MEYLGAPISGRQFQSHWLVNTKLPALQTRLDAIAKFAISLEPNKQSHESHNLWRGLHLLTHCASMPRTAHLNRVLHPDVIAPFTHAFDAAVRACLGRMMKLAPHTLKAKPIAWGRARLPPHRGGLCLRTGEGISACQYTACQVANHAAVTLMRPAHDDSNTCWHSSLRDVLRPLQEEVGEVSSVPSLLRRFFPPENPDPTTDEKADECALLELAEQRAAETYLARAHATGDHHEVKLIHACRAEKRSVCWLSLRPQQILIDDRTLCYALKLRLGLDTLCMAGPCTCHVKGGRATCQRSWSDALGIHAISCPSGGFRIAWHDGAVSVGERNANLAGAHAAAEPRYSPTGQREKNRRGDLKCQECPVTRCGPCFTDNVVKNALLDGPQYSQIVIRHGATELCNRAERQKRRDLPHNFPANTAFHPIAHASVGDACGDSVRAWYAALEAGCRSKMGDTWAKDPSRVPIRLHARLAIMRGVGSFLAAKNKQLARASPSAKRETHTHDRAAGLRATHVARTRMACRPPRERTIREHVVKHRDTILAHGRKPPMRPRPRPRPTLYRETHSATSYPARLWPASRFSPQSGPCDTRPPRQTMHLHPTFPCRPSSQPQRAPSLPAPPQPQPQHTIHQ